MSVNIISSGTSPFQDEVIYFLMVDRFHDGKERKTVSSKNKIKGFGSGEQLEKSCGGNLAGVIQKLDYIKNLGSTAIWLSPVFENNPESYHGYAIQNFLRVDPRFGTEEDLVGLVTAAHRLDLKVFLDVVINHSGNNWFYKKTQENFYQKGRLYEFGSWRFDDLPQPSLLRNPNYYFRKGMIRNWDTYPETRQGDFFSLKKFRLDESKEGLEVQDILTDIYQYWMRVTDCDGFRIDAAKHAGEQAVNRFCSKIRSYAASIGKKDFFIFAEVPSSDTYSFNFFKPYFSEKEGEIYHGPDSLLDFPLHFLLKKIVKGKEKPEKLKQRFASLEQLPQNLRKSLVTFLDNHDQIESSYKKRIAADLNSTQLLAAFGLLVTLPGVPCVYYGTEQALQGEGDSDSCIREAMFDFEREEGEDLFDEGAFFYQEMVKMLTLKKQYSELRNGKLSWPRIFESTSISGTLVPLVFIRELGDEKSLITFNSSNNEKLEFSVEIKYGDLPKDGSVKIRYTNLPEGDCKLKKTENKQYLFKIVLSPGQFIILK